MSKMRDLWDSVELKNSYWQRAQNIVVKKINSAAFKYQAVEQLLLDRKGLVVPWQIIASIHALEANLNWDKGLHNGERWDKTTTLVPKGKGPYASWEEAAVEALVLDRRSMPKIWNIPNTLDFLERYNGLGYRYKGLNSPYLWSGTNHYVKGKYVSDGKFDPEAISRQLGAVLILKGLYYNGRSSQGAENEVA